MESPIRPRAVSASPGWMYRLSGLVVPGLLCAAVTAWAVPPAPTLSPTDPTPEEEVVITIRARAFEPARIPLQAGRKVKLVFQNKDAELHAFVPVGLLAGLHLNISGDGAPEFHPYGFKRLIIPSQGTAVIRFVPVRTGEFPYFCDMPGHEMSATIVVE